MTAVTERQYQGQVHEHSRRLMAAWMDELSRAEAEGRPTGALMISGNCVASSAPATSCRCSRR